MSSAFSLGTSGRDQGLRQSPRASGQRPNRALRVRCGYCLPPLIYFPRFRARALFMAVLAVAAFGCGTRDRENPLDPQNPDTKGDPDWLDAIADDGAVDLS